MKTPVPTESVLGFGALLHPACALLGIARGRARTDARPPAAGAAVGLQNLAPDPLEEPYYSDYSILQGSLNSLQHHPEKPKPFTAPSREA